MNKTFVLTLLDFLKGKSPRFILFISSPNRNSIQEYEKRRSKKSNDRFHAIDYHEIPPNITLSAEKCGGPVNATCSSKGGLVELYITSDVESLDRYNGSGFALADRLLSLQNFSVSSGVGSCSLF